MLQYDVKPFRYDRPKTFKEALQQAIAWFIENRKRLPDLIVVEESQLVTAREAMESINADLARKFKQAQPIPVEATIGGCLLWEVWLGWMEKEAA